MATTRSVPSSQLRSGDTLVGHTGRRFEVDDALIQPTGRVLVYGLDVATHTLREFVLDPSTVVTIVTD